MHVFCCTYFIVSLAVYVEVVWAFKYATCTCFSTLNTIAFPIWLLRRIIFVQAAIGS